MRTNLRLKPTILRSSAALGLAFALTACSGGMDALTGMMGGGGSQQATVTPVTANTFGGVSVDQLRADQLCPSVVIQEGTEVLRLYSGEERNATTVRYQATILQTALECTAAAGQYGLTLGIAGRVLLGPQGSPASLDLPIRVAIVDTTTDDLLSSELIRATAVIEPTEVSATFTLVNRSFFLPTPNRQSDYQVLVGFDEAGS
ncbi:MAG: hypothetical protein Rhims3KO_02280 [Hyphomicrobiales bacterium]